MKNGGFLKYRQKYDKFSKSFFISRNMRFGDMRPWGQKVSKGPKETFPTPRIKIKVVYGTQRIFQKLQIIVHFWHSQYIPLEGKSNIWTARGKTFLNLIEDTRRYLLAFLEVNYLSNSQSYVFMKLTSCRSLELYLKLVKIAPRRKIPPNVCRQGGNNVDPGDSHVYLLSPQNS